MVKAKHAHPSNMLPSVNYWVDSAHANMQKYGTSKSRGVFPHSFAAAFVAWQQGNGCSYHQGAKDKKCDFSNGVPVNDELHIILVFDF